MNSHRIRRDLVVVVVVLLVVIFSRGASGWAIDRRDAVRRVVVAGIVATATTTSTSDVVNNKAWALGEGEPRMILTQPPKAPLRALLPAARARLLLEQCRVWTVNLIQANKGGALRRLQSVLVPLDDDGNSARIINNNNYVLSGRGVRAAMNLYTANLSYGSQPVYDVTDPQWKKKYIRANDGLPNVKKVISADLELRDLYRNQVEWKLDDAAAELYSTSCDGDELQDLLQDAAASYDQWLGMIADIDVQEALQAAIEGKSSSLPVYESYYAGFVPPHNDNNP